MAALACRSGLMRSPMKKSFWLVVFTLLGPAVAEAQDACESKCNQASAECLRTCVAKPTNTPKDSKEQSAKMMQCLNICEAQAKPCREACHPPKK